MEREQTNRVRVEIHGSQYTLRSRDPADRIKEVARMVDEKMQQIGDSHTWLDSRRIAVLTALQLAEEVRVLREENRELTLLLEERTRVNP